MLCTPYHERSVSNPFMSSRLPPFSGVKGPSHAHHLSQLTADPVDSSFARRPGESLTRLKTYRTFSGLSPSRTLMTVQSSPRLYQPRGYVPRFAPEEPIRFSRIQAHSNSVNCLAVADALVWSGGTDYFVKAWNSSGMPELAVKAHARAVKALAVSENSLLVTAGGDNKLRFWHLQDDCECVGTQLHPSLACVVLASPLTLVSGGDGLRVWDMQTRALAQAFTPGAKPERTLAHLGGSSILSGSEDSQVRLWDLRSPGSRSRFSEHRAPVNALEVWDEYSFFSAGADMAVLVSDKQKWDLRTGGVLQRVLEQFEVKALATANDQLVLGGTVLKPLGASAGQRVGTIKCMVAEAEQVYAGTTTGELVTVTP